MKNVKLRGFTLPELLVVLAIIGILVLLALPRLTPLITKTKATEAKLQLKHLHTLQSTFFYTHSEYSDKLSDLGFEQELLKTEGGSALYRVEIIEKTPTSFKAQATAVVDFDGDGVYNVWQIDEKQQLSEITPD